MLHKKKVIRLMQEAVGSKYQIKGTLSSRKWISVNQAVLQVLKEEKGNGYERPGSEIMGAHPKSHSRSQREVVVALSSCTAAGQ